MHKRYSYILSLLLLLSVGITTVNTYRSYKDKGLEAFDALAFDQMGYTDEDLNLFCDIAFNRDGKRIRRWVSDIKVEIKEPYRLKKESIAEVDSVIAILATLIAPLKIERVWVNGNVHVYRNVDRVALSGNNPKVPIALKGLTKKNRESDVFGEIYHASVYVREGAHTQTLLHEFQHVVGLEHPLRIYPYYTTIGRSIIPEVLYLDTEFEKFSIPFYISEQEKTSIRMLYSSQIKSGLKKDTFLDKIDKIKNESEYNN